MGTLPSAASRMLTLFKSKNRDSACQCQLAFP